MIFILSVFIGCLFSIWYAIAAIWAFFAPVIAFFASVWAFFASTWAITTAIYLFIYSNFVYISLGFGSLGFGYVVYQICAAVVALKDGVIFYATNPSFIWKTTSSVILSPQSATFSEIFVAFLTLLAGYFLVKFLDKFLKDWRFENEIQIRHQNRHNVYGVPRNPPVEEHFEHNQVHQDDLWEPFQGDRHFEEPRALQPQVVQRPQNYQPQNYQPQVAVNTPRVRESPEAHAQRRQVLSTFKCPFEVEETVCQKSQTGCMFGHNVHLQTNLKDIPSYLCTYNLLNFCTSATPDDCINGLHLENIALLLDLKTLERRSKHQIRRYFGKDKNRQCYICQENVLSKVLSKKRRFAILKSCSHVFCADCLQRWANENLRGNLRAGQVECPVCRAFSAQFLIRRRFTDNIQQKIRLFGGQQTQRTY